MAWQEILHKDIFLLWEHNALTGNFNIMNNIILIFCTIHVTIHFSQMRHDSAANVEFDCIDSGSLHTYCRPNISLNTLYTKHDISYSIWAKHDNDIGCYDCEIQTHVNALCSHKGIYLYA